MLVVDDEPDMRRTLEDMLLLNGYAPRTAANGRAALDLARGGSFPAAIVDLRLPDIDGLDVAAGLQEHDDRVEVIILTGHASVETAIRAVRDQGCDYLVKPVAPEDLVRTVGAAVDRWLRRAAEDHLRQTESMLRALFEASPLPLIVLDPDLGVRLWNRAAERVFGWSAEEARGRPLSALDPQGHAHARRVFAEVLGGSTATGVEVRRRRQDGVLLDMRMSAAAITDRDGAPSAVLAVFEDITEQLRVEAHLSHVQRLDAVGRLAGGIAHDFNNLLAVIHTEADLALDHGGLSEPVEESITVVRDTAERGAALTRQLLTFARREPLRSQVVDANHVVSELERMLRPLITEPVEMRVEPGEDVGRVNVDRGQLEQVLTNLVVNARDAIEGPGTITISTRSHDVTAEGSQLGLDSGEWVVISVTDTGSGIPDALRARIFEPFFTTKAADAGTGLGLATSYGIAQRMGGLIAVESTVGSGSTFHVCLPRAQGPAAEGAAVARDMAPTGSETILLVEDDADLRDAARRILIRQGYSVQTAADGQEAWSALDQMARVPDLLLTDAHLPTGHGADLIRKLRERFPRLKCMLTSGSSGPLDTRDYTIPFIAKPYTFDSLARAVRSALDAGSRP